MEVLFLCLFWTGCSRDTYQVFKVAETTFLPRSERELELIKNAMHMLSELYY